MAKDQSRQSIKTKLTYVIMAISVLLLVIVSVVVLTAETFATRTAMIQEIRALSAALGTNSRQSLVLGQYQEAEKFLQALSTQPHIHAAYLFDNDGEPVAEYLPQKDVAFVWKYLQQDFAAANRSYWTKSTSEQINTCFFHLAVFTPIFFDGNRVGTLYVLSDLEALYGRLSAVAFGITLSLLLLLVFSLFLAGRLQKPVLDPLLNLAGVMEKISARKDYSVRAKKVTNDEIALLVDGLNHMLDQVEEHQRQQSRLQEHLELTVDQRTAELRAAVVELEKARRKADAANEAKSQFLSRMTHELRTPLIGVLGMNGLLQRTSLTEHQRTLADTVEKSGNDLLALIGDVLDIARIEAGVIDLNTEEVDVARIIEEVVELLAPQAHAKGLELLAEIPLRAFCSARGDRSRIWQIVMNLVGNAIKFTPRGLVRVRLRVTPKRLALGRFVIDVEDTGIGMDETTRQHVFDLFYQHQGSFSLAAGGSGLGLPIVKQLVELMDGRIHVESHPRTGSRFVVELTLPLLDGSQPVVTTDTEGLNIVFGMNESVAATLLERQLQELEVAHVRAASVRGCRDKLDELHQQGAACTLLLSRDWYDQLVQQQVRLEAAQRLVLVCRDSAADLPALPETVYLSQPITWRQLNQMLVRLQEQKVNIAREQGNDAVIPSDPVREHGKVVFVGRHAAQRQLLRLALSACQLTLDCVDTLEEGVVLGRSSDVVIMILDTSDVTAVELRDLETLLGRLPPCYLLTDGDVPDVCAAKFAGELSKPINKAGVLEVIDSLSLDNEESDSVVAGEVA